MRRAALGADAEQLGCGSRDRCRSRRSAKRWSRPTRESLRRAPSRTLPVPRPTAAPAETGGVERGVDAGVDDGRGGDELVREGVEVVREDLVDGLGRHRVRLSPRGRRGRWPGRSCRRRTRRRTRRAARDAARRRARPSGGPAPPVSMSVPSMSKSRTVGLHRDHAVSTRGRRRRRGARLGEDAREALGEAPGDARRHAHDGHLRVDPDAGGEDRAVGDEEPGELEALAALVDRAAPRDRWRRARCRAGGRPCTRCGGRRRRARSMATGLGPSR